MAYVGGNTDDRARFAHIGQVSAFDPRALDGETIYRTLQANMADVSL